MTLRVPDIIPSRHILSDERRAEIRRDVNRQLDRNILPAITPAEAAWYETHYSNGMPMPSAPEYVVRTMLGRHVCAVCGEDVDYPGECPKCCTFIDPHWDQVGAEDALRSYDAKREP